MAILGAAFQALQRNRGPLLFFIGVATIVYSLQLVFYTLVIEPRSGETLERSIQFYSITVDIAGVAVIALAQTIAFSRIGRDVDRPMWRIEDDWEALKRFYGLWLLLGLASIAILRIVDIIATTTEEDSAGLVLFMLWLTIAALIVPFGSAVMFYGQVRRQEIGEAVSTMFRHFQYILLFAIIGIFFGIMISDLQSTLPLWARPALAIANGYLECLLFAAMWLVCIYHRDHIDRPDDQDFDF